MYENIIVTIILQYNLYEINPKNLKEFYYFYKK